jgi:hypothetical protein
VVSQKVSDQLRASERDLKKQQREVAALKKNAKTRKD